VAVVGCVVFEGGGRAVADVPLESVDLPPPPRPSHLVTQAHRHVPPELPLGVPAALISDTVDIGAHLDTKRAAITAHDSQVPATSDIVTMPSSAFALDESAPHAV
jgi:LmbE family N-acetylglucosaminyl deacetylase